MTLTGLLGGCVGLGEDSCKSPSVTAFFAEKPVTKDLSSFANQYPELAYEIQRCRADGFQRCDSLMYGWDEEDSFPTDTPEIFYVVEWTRYRSGCTYDMSLALTPPTGRETRVSPKYTVPTGASGGGRLWNSVRLTPDRNGRWPPGTFKGELIVNGVVKAQPSFTVTP